MTTNKPLLTDTALEAALARYAGRVSATGLQAGIMADVAATEQARRPLLALPGPLAHPAAPGRLAAIPTVAWVLLLTGLLLGLVVGGLAGGLWRSPDRAVVVVPSRSPVATVNPAVATVLATTKAHPLPAQATCPAGSNPDTPGPADQVRAGGAMAFDRRAGRIVMLAQAEGADEAVDPEGWGASQTWIYDVCANTWQRIDPPEEPRGGWGSPGPARLVYDADSDRTLAFAADDEIWSYELAAGRWSRVGSLRIAADGAANTTYGTIFYHDPSGLVVVYDGVSMWAYDVETDTLTEVPQRPDPSLPAGSGLPEGKIAFGYDPVRDLVVAVVVPHGPALGGNPPQYTRPTDPWGETWTFDPGTGIWHKETSPAAADLIVCGFWWNSIDCWPTSGRAVFDEASGMTLFLQRDLSKPRSHDRVDAYDAVTRTWRTLAPDTTQGGDRPYWCASTPPVYDPLNARIVCQGTADSGRGVSVFSTATGSWRWLLDP
jgi:hypothetical protein